MCGRSELGGIDGRGRSEALAEVLDFASIGDKYRTYWRSELVVIEITGENGPPLVFQHSRLVMVRLLITAHLRVLKVETV